jgi:hypothetical protein
LQHHICHPYFIPVLNFTAIVSLRLRLHVDAKPARHFSAVREFEGDLLLEPIIQWDVLG